MFIKKVLVAVSAIITFSFWSQSSAQEMSQGEMAGIIRAADYPCKRVLALQSTGENSWKVTCNSGNFFVIRNADGQYTVTQPNESSKTE